MSTRYTKFDSDGVSVPTGYEGNNIPDDFVIPSCTVEDVDRALFNLFNKEIPLIYQQKNETHKIPVIFATGERFAVLRRKRPLRDNQGALILPLISIMRTGIEQEATRGIGPGQGSPLTIKQRLDKKDPRYQALVNKLGLDNQDNVATSGHRLGMGPDREVDLNKRPTGTKGGTVATRDNEYKTSLSTRNGKVLMPDIGDNIFEIITMPPVKYYTATYDVTFWAQYTVQMNNMITAMMGAYQNNHKRTFRLESDKGYWFVAYVASSLAPSNNFDNFTDDERIVRYNFSIEVPGYIVLPEFPGSESGLRKFVSAPRISFDSMQVNGQEGVIAKGGPPSGDVKSYILEDLSTLQSELPAGAPGTSPIASTEMIAGGDTLGGAVATSDSRSIQAGKGGTAAIPIQASANIGQYTGRTDEVGTSFVQLIEDPFTGEKDKKLFRVKSRIQRKGETVLRDGIIKDLDNGE